MENSVRAALIKEATRTETVKIQCGYSRVKTRETNQNRPYSTKLSLAGRTVLVVLIALVLILVVLIVLAVLVLIVFVSLVLVVLAIVVSGIRHIGLTSVKM
ncbi:MAG: hypothetical protein IJL15_01560 [Clostridia bacterium]|nr:hypothetical protein [Clostridia bacterium]